VKFPKRRMAQHVGMALYSAAGELVERHDTPNVYLVMPWEPVRFPVISNLDEASDTDYGLDQLPGLRAEWEGLYDFVDDEDEAAIIRTVISRIDAALAMEPGTTIRFLGD
jgi:hypothetical protein